MDSTTVLARRTSGAFDDASEANGGGHRIEPGDNAEYTRNHTKHVKHKREASVRSRSFRVGRAESKCEP
jgi:hypothetical protein